MGRGTVWVFPLKVETKFAQKPRVLRRDSNLRKVFLNQRSMRKKVVARRDWQHSGNKAPGTDKSRERRMGNAKVGLEEFLHCLLCEHEAGRKSVQ
jgi:hypothetical protein